MRGEGHVFSVDACEMPTNFVPVVSGSKSTAADGNV